MFEITAFTDCIKRSVTLVKASRNITVFAVMVQLKVAIL
jgi:hypothetical protein